MKNNHSVHIKTIFLTFLSLLFVAILLPISTTLGKYSKELDSLDVNVEFTLTPELFDHDPPYTSNTPGIEEETPTTTYQVQPGDTLDSIAKKFHTTVEALVAYNKIEDPTNIEPGMILHIPPMDYVIPGMNTDSAQTID